MPSTGFVLRTISSSGFLFVSSHIAFQICQQPFWQMGLEGNLDSRCGESTCFPGMGKLGSRAGKTPHLRICIRKIFTTPSYWIRVHLDLVRQMNKASGWGYYMSAVYKHHPRSLCWLHTPLPLLHHNQIPSDWAPVFPTISIVQDQILGPHKAPNYAGIDHLSLLGSLLTLEKTEVQGKPLHGVCCPGVGWFINA